MVALLRLALCYCIEWSLCAQSTDPYLTSEDSKSMCLLILCFIVFSSFMSPALKTQVDNANKHVEQYKQIASSCEEALKDANQVKKQCRFMYMLSFLRLRHNHAGTPKFSIGQWSCLTKLSQHFLMGLNLPKLDLVTMFNNGLLSPCSDG